MCECGCGDLHPFAQFPALNGDTYLLEIYPGCGDCHLGPGVAVHRVTRKEMREMGLSDVPVPEWTHNQFAVPIMDAESLRDALREEAGDEFVEDLDASVGNVNELLRDATLSRLNRFRKEAADGRA